MPKKRGHNKFYKHQIPYDDTKKEFVNRKKELIIKDYESLFTVYGRETTIIYSFRGWAVTLLTVYFTFLFTVKPTDKFLIYFPGLFILLTFLMLEVSERSVMKNLLTELRELEKMFMIEDIQTFNTAVLNFEFRDLKDEKRPFSTKVKAFFIALVDMKVVFWNIFLGLIYLCFTYYFSVDNSKQIKNATLNKTKTQIDTSKKIIKIDTAKSLKQADTTHKK